MARSKTSKTINRVTRDTVVIANPAPRLRYSSTYSPLTSLSTSFTQRFAPLYLQQDGRTYHPDGRNRPDIAVPRSAGRLVVRSVYGSGKAVRVAANPFATVKWGAERVGFATPRKVATCVRRKIRREVLLAFGRGGAGNKKPRWRASSHISCRG